MKTSVLALVAFAASFVLAGPVALQPRDSDCQVAQFPNGEMCCMGCGCYSLDNLSCRMCLQGCMCGDNISSCPF
ncbi:hypothetical protein V8F20_012214 [Naviculisporaceae sp. PSN 640]